ncbi:MAG: TSUP family transporter [Lachnospiraceae bacterium]
MNITPAALIIVCPLVFLAGFVDSIAGGGGLISLPAYLLAGIPVHNAIATNKLSSCIGTSVSTWRYVKNRYADIALAVPCILVALIGATLGAKLSMKVDGIILERVLLIVLPLSAFVVLHKKKENTEKRVATLSRTGVFILASVCSLMVGLYDGFYGPGTGTFLLLCYTGLCGMDIKIASGNTKLVNLASNFAALATFLVHGKTLILLGLIASVFCMAGHYLGSGLVMKKGTTIVKPIIILVLALLFVKIIFKI